MAPLASQPQQRVNASGFDVLSQSVPALAKFDELDRRSVATCATNLGKLRTSDGGVGKLKWAFTHRQNLLRMLSDRRLRELCASTDTQQALDAYVQAQFDGCVALLVKEPSAHTARSAIDGRREGIGQEPDGGGGSRAVVVGGLGNLCVMGLSYGCSRAPGAPSATLWTEAGCVGRFRCDNTEPPFECGNASNVSQRVHCPCHRYMDAASELRLTERYDAIGWWRMQMATQADPSVHAEYMPAAEHGPVQAVRPLAVVGIPHGYGAFLASAVADAWDVERQGGAPLLMLPSWLAHEPLKCNLSAPAIIDGEGAAAAARRLSLASLLSERSHACSSLHLTCFTSARRGCTRPGLATSSTRTLWRERLASSRPSQPLNGAPFWVAAEYTAALLRPNAAFEEKMLAPLLSQLAMHRPSLAVHLRFGDSCLASEASRTKRQCGPISEYVDAAARLHARYAFRSVVLASDSRRAEEHFRRAWAQRTPVYSTGASANMGGDELASKGTNFERSVRGLVMRGGRNSPRTCQEWRQFSDLFGDLHALASCDGLVGKLTSNLDRLALALMAARVGRIPPFISLDNSTWCNNHNSTWGSSKYGAFPCRSRTIDDPDEEDARLLHVLGPDGRVIIAEPRRMPGRAEPADPARSSAPQAQPSASTRRVPPGSHHNRG